MKKAKETLHSMHNRFFLNLRNRIRFSRPGYGEEQNPLPKLHAEEIRLQKKFKTGIYCPKMTAATYQKNLATLWILEQMIPTPLANTISTVIEAGCQDFSRLPAISLFFLEQGMHPQVIGVELDGYPILADLHSRADRARYYLSLMGEQTKHEYVVKDFFQYQNRADLLLSFYPFVSPHPALAWGIPAEFGDAAKWVEAACKNLNPGGMYLVVHQGIWEEEEFDLARQGWPLELKRRERIDCPFAPTPYPAQASLYLFSGPA